MINKTKPEHMTKIEKKFLSEDEVEQLMLIRTYYRKLNDANGELRIE